MDVPMAFVADEQDHPELVVRVNFGVFAGREATPAELDRLAEWLLDEVGEVSIISEDRLETDGTVEASVHQVVIQVTDVGRDREDLTRRILERAEYWAHVCVNERHAEIADGV